MQHQQQPQAQHRTSQHEFPCSSSNNSHAPACLQSAAPQAQRSHARQHSNNMHQQHAATSYPLPARAADVTGTVPTTPQHHSTQSAPLFQKVTVCLSLCLYVCLFLVHLVHAYSLTHSPNQPPLHQHTNTHSLSLSLTLSGVAWFVLHSAPTAAQGPPQVHHLTPT